jgi:GNAT superfamily N-acetyltransferase
MPRSTRAEQFIDPSRYAVLEPIRGTGIGRQLMDAFEQWAKDRESVLVSLATRGAAAFYEHRGYTSKAATTRSTLRLALRGDARVQMATRHPQSGKAVDNV